MEETLREAPGSDGGTCWGCRCRIRLDEDGRLDGSGNTPNTDWVDLTEEQKRMVPDRMLTNGRSILEEASPREEVAYPGLDFIELNAQQQNVVRQESRSTTEPACGRPRGAQAGAGERASIPPAVVVTSWTYTDKEGIPEQGAIIPGNRWIGR